VDWCTEARSVLVALDKKFGGLCAVSVRPGDSGRFAVDASRKDAEEQEGWHCMDGFEAVFMRGLAMLPAGNCKCICRTSRHRIVICA
jgi:hypothetical protein